MRYDDVVIGAGHNGLTAAAYLARAGRRVLVLERSGQVGGAAVSVRAFEGVDARLSRYAYLVSLLPGQIITDLELDVRLVRRRFSSYTPVPGDPTGGVLVDTADPAATREGFRRLTGDDAAHDGWTRFYDRMARLAERVHPTVLEPLRSRSDMRALSGDDALFDALTERPISELIESVTDDDTLRGIIATDALIGTFASLDDPALRQNICLLYHLVGGGTGDWDVPVGGMGAVTDALARTATEAGATIQTGAEVTAVDPSTREVSWPGGSARADHVLAACAPTVLNDLLSRAGAPPIRTEQDVEGAQLKVNLLLTRLPRLRDGSTDPRAAFAGTFHVNEGYRQLNEAYAAVLAGRVPDLPPCEVYCHTLTDRSILGPSLHDTDAQTLTVFGLHFPARLFRVDNTAVTREAVSATIRSIDSVLAEPIEDLLVRDTAGNPCIEARSPVDLEESLGLPGGNIWHRSLQWPWADSADEVGTWGVETPHEGLLIAGAGARRGGGVSGIPGHNAARAVLARLGVDR
ncbi:MAG TPA: NAD(P)/FAD-dependent oxidoreductase [Intrasporangium sp.]|uniref:phytoene desaturase family protein n=1 Tax=Intrasporangium sp. TaxID=1925024 RepID=UPI002B4737ED|nr:NAD(P)/FAD-dependent oxidoreductase [Intrasporangium sp.]HKX68620.1 NAD(P)/FAD-dependent oxidoreductase [Intrasporangium sp.]